MILSENNQKYQKWISEAKADTVGANKLEFGPDLSRELCVTPQVGRPAIYT